MNELDLYLAGDTARGYTKVYEGKKLAQSSALRHYVNVPAGASAMRVRLEVSGDTGARDGAGVLTEICNPEGVPRGGFAGYARKTGNQITDQTILRPELYPGTWEINVASSILNLDLSDMDKGLARLSVTITDENSRRSVSRSIDFMIE